MKIVVVVQLLSHVQLCVTPWTSACQAFLSFTISQSLLKFMSIDSVMLSNLLILCCEFPTFPSVIDFYFHSIVVRKYILYYSIF